MRGSWLAGVVLNKKMVNPEFELKFEIVCCCL